MNSCSFRRFTHVLEVAEALITVVLASCSYLEFLQALEKKVDENWPEISASLEEIRKTLISKNDCLINLTADEKNLKNSEKHISNFLDMLPNTSPVDSVPLSARLSPTNEAIVVPTQVCRYYILIDMVFLCVH